MFKKTILATALIASGFAFAQEKGNPTGFVISSADGSAGLTADQIAGTAPPPTAAALTLETPQGNVQTFGLAGDADNCLVTVSLPEGLQVTGSSFDVRVETIGASWLNEAQFQFRTSDPNDPQINLTPVVATGAPGNEDATSGGIINFADVPLDNIPVGADGEFRIEMVDTFDDNAAAADADFFNLPAGAPFGLTFQCDDQAACDAAFADPAAFTTAGSCAGWEFAAGGGGGELPESQPVPVNNFWALGLMALLIAGLGTVVIRRMF